MKGREQGVKERVNVPRREGEVRQEGKKKKVWGGKYLLPVI